MLMSAMFSFLPVGSFNRVKPAAGAGAVQAPRGMARHCSGGRTKSHQARRKRFVFSAPTCGDPPSEGDQRSAAAMGEQLVIGQPIDQRLIALVMKSHLAVAIESTAGGGFLAQAMNLLAVADLQVHALALGIRVAPGNVLLALAFPANDGGVGARLTMAAATEPPRCRQQEQAFQLPLPVVLVFHQQS